MSLYDLGIVVIAWRNNGWSALVRSQGDTFSGAIAGQVMGTEPPDDKVAGNRLYWLPRVSVRTNHFGVVGSDGKERQ